MRTLRSSVVEIRIECLPLSDEHQDLAALAEDDDPCRPAIADAGERLRHLIDGRHFLSVDLRDDVARHDAASRGRACWIDVADKSATSAGRQV